MAEPIASPRTGRGLLLAGALALAGIALMIALGTWQLSRRAEKAELTARITEHASAEPVTLERAVAAWKKGADVEYLRVRLTGRFIHEHERLLFATEHGAPGWHVYTPFATGFQHVVFAPKLVMVNRGFVPDARRDPAARPEAASKDPVSIVALLRVPPEAKATFENENDPARNRWYWRDLQAMIASIPKERLPKHAPFLPFFIEVEAGAAAASAPKGGATRLDHANRHLEYALTWYGLAGTLAAVYGVWAWGRIRKD